MTEQNTGTPTAADTADLSPEDRAYFESAGALTPGEDTSAPATEDAAPPTGLVDDADLGEDDAADGKRNDGRYVRHGAFHAERERRKAAEKALEEQRIGHARLEERLNLLTQAFTPPPAQEQQLAAPPNADEDPLGYIKWLGEKVTEASKTATQVREQTAEVQDQQRLVSTYQQDAVRFAKATPDFGDAYSHLISSRDQELQLYGVANQQDRARIIQQEEAQLVRNAMQAGKSPAEVVYGLAKTRGYAVKAPPAQEQSSAADEVSRLAAVAAASKSLSNAGGRAGGELNAKALAEMSDAEFQAIYEKVQGDPAKMRQLFGG